ncbi:MAG: hypothetical protein ATN35_00335 [Epulopiscium sp. Nele67-Bin004]|nr:MAG: hypothetical protein ATN35_00335 [Epulopiscium sp. Nele67-Bin004]
MNKFLAHNLHLKIYSLVLAIMLWLFVINTQNPIQSQDIKNLEVDVVGLALIQDKGFVVQNEDELMNLTINVDLQGQRLELEQLLSNQDSLIQAEVNISRYATELNPNTGTSERSVPITVNLMIDNVVIDDYNPKLIYVTFESEDIRTFQIEYEIEGKEDSQYMTLDPIIKVTDVEITGPESKLASIEKVMVNINVDEFSEDTLTYKLPIIAYDIDGNEVTELVKNPQTAEVILPIGKKVTVPIEAQIGGSLPSGYIHTNTIITPSEITIVGKEEVVDEIASIKLNPIYLTNLIENTTKQVEFIMPDGIEYMDKIDNNAVVTMEIQKISTYEFNIDIDNVNLTITGLSDHLEYEFISNYLILTLGGTAEELLGFDKTSVAASISLRDLEPGEYTLPVEVSIDDTVQIVDEFITLDISIFAEEIIVELELPDPETIEATIEEQSEEGDMEEVEDVSEIDQQ